MSAAWRCFVAAGGKMGYLATEYVRTEALKLAPAHGAEFASLSTKPGVGTLSFPDGSKLCFFDGGRWQVEPPAGEVL